MLWGSAIFALAYSGRLAMAWKTRPCLCGGLISLTDVLPCGKTFRSVYGSVFNLLCGANKPIAKASAVCRVACLEWTVRIGDQAHFVVARRVLSLLLEILSAKEAKKR